MDQATHKGDVFQHTGSLRGVQFGKNIIQCIINQCKIFCLFQFHVHACTCARAVGGGSRRKMGPIASLFIDIPDRFIPCDKSSTN